MKKLYLLLSLLLCGSPAFAMNQPQELKKYIKQEEKKRQREVASVLTKAFCQLPQNSLTTGQDRTVFQDKIQKHLPKVLVNEISKYAGTSNAPFINQHLKELIPCVVKKHTDYPSMQEMVKKVEPLLQNTYSIRYFPHRDIMPAKNLSDKPYILAIAGFWSFSDEKSKLRGYATDHDFANDFRDIFAADGDRLHDVSEWFAHEYPTDQVKPINDNEFLGILYSDGTIGWKLSPLNMARLKGKLHKYHLELAEDLSSSSGMINHKQLQDYDSMPDRYREIILSNFGYKFSVPSYINYKTSGYSQKFVSSVAMGCLGGLSLYGAQEKWGLESGVPGILFIVGGILRAVQATIERKKTGRDIINFRDSEFKVFKTSARLAFEVCLGIMVWVMIGDLNQWDLLKSE